MTITRRYLIKARLAAGTALSMPSFLRVQISPYDARTIRMVMSDLTVFDPIPSTPVSDNRKTYTFQLREGLSFHDGSPVTAADCVASIRNVGPKFSNIPFNGLSVVGEADAVDVVNGEARWAPSLLPSRRHDRAWGATVFGKRCRVGPSSLTPSTRNCAVRLRCEWNASCGSE